MMAAEQQRAALAAAINDCDRMILQADIDNDAERADHRNDPRRLARYQRRRTDLLDHAKKLENLYNSLYNHV